MKTLKLLLTYLVILLFFSSCRETKYIWDDVNLQVATHNAVIGISGNIDDSLMVLEEDDYGRILFAYISVDNNLVQGDLMILIIVQKATDEITYVYDGINYLYTDLEGHNTELTKFMVDDFFSNTAIDQLKLANDWGQPLDETRWFSIEVSTSKPFLVPNRTISQLRDTLDEVKFCSGCVERLSIDKNQKKLLVFRKMILDENDHVMPESPTYLVMFDENNKIIEGTGIKYIPQTDIMNIYEILNQFKIDNDWAFR